MSCNGNVYNIGMGCCQPVLGPIENYYTKWQTDDKIEEAVSGISAVTIDEVQEMIDESISGISGVTEEQMNNAITAATDGLATTAYVNTQISAETGDFIDGEELSSYTYDKLTIDSKIASGGTFDPTQYYNKTATDALLANKLNISDFNSYSADAKTYIDNKVSEVSGSTDTISGDVMTLSGDVIALSGEVQSKAYTAYVDQRLNRKVDNIISTGEVVDVLITGASSLDNWPLIVGYDYVLIPDNIYNVYGFNPAGTEGVYNFGRVEYGYLYINANYTVSGDQEEYESVDGKFRLPVADIDTTKVNRIYTAPDGITVTLVKEGNDINATEEIKKISGKQDILTAGTGVNISENVISMKIWSGTKAQFDAITTKDNETIYLVTD